VSSVASRTTSGASTDRQGGLDYQLGSAPTGTGLSQLSRAAIAATINPAWTSSAAKLVLNIEGGDAVSSSWLAELVSRVVLLRDRAGDITSLGVPSARILRDAFGSLVIEVTATPQPSESTSITEPREKPIGRIADISQNLSDHTRLAAELRGMTGLPASLLASAFGVSREQYQRWLAGKAISTVRHGQLTYLHSIAREIVRKLGERPARVWWHTPGADGRAPEALLADRNLGALYSWAVSIHDPQPVEGSTLPGLRRADESWDEDPPDGIEDQADWSPYPASGTKHE